MSREEPRRCSKCGYQWWAVKVSKPPKLRWFEDSGSLFQPGQAAARNVRLGHRKSEQIREWERYGLCARCGSHSVATVRSKGFLPTALAEARAVGHPPSSAPSPPSPPPAAGGFLPGDRVTLHMLGFRGKTGIVENVRPDGSCDVRLDDRRTLVKRIPAGKLTAADS